MQRVATATWGLLAVLLAVHIAHAIDGGDSAFVQDWVYQAVRTLVGVLVLVRVALRPEDRAGWTLLGLGLLSAAAGDLVWTLKYDDATGAVPTPSLADVLYVASYPLIGLALLRLIRRPPGSRTAMWIDGAIGGLVPLVVLTELVVEGLDWDAMDPASLWTNLAYVVGDAIVLGLLLAVLAVRAWRVEGRHVALVGGALVLVATDSVYLRDAADGVYPIGPLDAGWLVSATCFALAAWLPAPARARAEGDPVRRAAILPVAGGVVGVAALVFCAVESPFLPTLGVAALLTLSAFARFAATGLDHHRLMLASRRDAATDHLTGLGNRRRLVADLADPDAGPRTLVLLDLDGFKLYNDTFGHPAGDVLLTMIADVLRTQLHGEGEAYRLGGDEFCVLVPASSGPPEVVGRRLAHAVVHDGHGFHVGASHGVVGLPQEASTPSEALALADRRLYASKHARRGSAGRQSADVLLAVLAERTPALTEHADAVASMAVEVGARLGLRDLELEHLRQAAQLHDVGKIAIPESVLDKTEPLDEAEWKLLRRHTVIGERVLSVAPALAPVGALVRASHERWDGTGYPDGLRGREIPLGARIILACDVLDALTSPRAAREPMPEPLAIEELRRSAGTQLDPRVVDAVIEVLAARRAAKVLSRTR